VVDQNDVTSVCPLGHMGLPVSTTSAGSVPETSEYGPPVSQINSEGVVGDRVVGVGTVGTVGTGTDGTVGTGTVGTVGTGTVGTVGVGTVGIVGVGTVGTVGTGIVGTVGTGTVGTEGTGTVGTVGTGTVGDGAVGMVGVGTVGATGVGADGVCSRTTSKVVQHVDDVVRPVEGSRQETVRHTSYVPTVEASAMAGLTGCTMSTSATALSQNASSRLCPAGHVELPLRSIRAGKLLVVKLYGPFVAHPISLLS
jgi:hypothetical protein